MTCGHLHPQSRTGDPADTKFDNRERVERGPAEISTMQSNNTLWYERKRTWKINISGKSSHIWSFSPVHFNFNGTLIITDGGISRIWAFWQLLSIYDEENHEFLKSDVFNLSLKHWEAYLQSNKEPRPTSVAHHYFLHHYPLLPAACEASAWLVAAKHVFRLYAINWEVFDFKPFFQRPTGARHSEDLTQLSKHSNKPRYSFIKLWWSQK